MNYALDIIVLIILIISIVTSLKRVVRSLLEFLFNIIAFFVAKTYTPAVQCTIVKT
jgi:uncharacterized membrane protein required for colicin V production